MLICFFSTKLCSLYRAAASSPSDSEHPECRRLEAVLATGATYATGDMPSAPGAAVPPCSLWNVRKDPLWAPLWNNLDLGFS